MKNKKRYTPRIGLANFNRIKHTKRFKNNNKYADLVFKIIISALLLVLVALVVIRKNSEYSKLNRELNHTTFFAVNNDTKNLIALKDNKEINIFSLEQYDSYEYQYYNGKIYIYLYDVKSNKSTLNYIDLKKGKGKYKLEHLYTFDKMVYKLAVVDNYIYCYIDGHNVLDRYSIKDKKLEETKIPATPDFAASKNKLFYIEKNELYMLDLIKEEVSLIDDSPHSKSINYAYNNKLIYEQKEQSNQEITDNYYEYDINSKQISKIGRKKEKVTEDFTIAPYKGGYIFVDNENTVKIMDRNKNVEDFYHFELDPYKLVLLPDSRIEISFITEINSDNSMFALTTRMNLKNKMFLKGDSDNKYSYIIYL